MFSVTSPTVRNGGNGLLRPNRTRPQPLILENTPNSPSNRRYISHDNASVESYHYSSEDEEILLKSSKYICGAPILPQFRRRRRLRDGDSSSPKSNSNTPPDRWHLISNLAADHKNCDPSILDISHKRDLTPETLRYGVTPEVALKITELRYDAETISQGCGWPRFLDVISTLFINLRHLRGSSVSPPKSAVECEQDRMFRLYVLYRLPDLRSINGQMVTKEECNLARPCTPSGVRVRREDWCTKAMKREDDWCTTTAMHHGDTEEIHDSDPVVSWEEEDDDSAPAEEGVECFLPHDWEPAVSMNNKKVELQQIHEESDEDQADEDYEIMDIVKKMIATETIEKCSTSQTTTASENSDPFVSTEVPSQETKPMNPHEHTNSPSRQDSPKPLNPINSNVIIQSINTHSSKFFRRPPACPNRVKIPVVLNKLPKRKSRKKRAISVMDEATSSSEEEEEEGEWLLSPTSN